MTTYPSEDSINGLFGQRSFLFASVALVCFALATVQAQLSPPPDGGYFKDNTAEGTDALYHLSPLQSKGGFQNTAVGYRSLYNNTSGRNNSAVGDQTLWGNTTGDFNTANGSQALLNNVNGSFNTANGYRAIFYNLTGKNNTATGYQALLNNNGDYNTADGFEALLTNKGGLQNTAIGWQALYHNTNGNKNTAIGCSALSNCSTGINNTANGFQALEKTTGSFNIGIGYRAGGNLNGGNNNIYIGHGGPAVPGSESNTIHIGTVGTHSATYVAGIANIAGGTAVNVLPNGQLITTGSSHRFKNEIKPMDQTSEIILGLKPVTFHYKNDDKGAPQFGLVAEEVAQVNPDLVVRDEKGEIYGVRYDAVNAMLLNEFLKQHRTVQELKSIVARQEAALAQQLKTMETLAAGLAKVNAQIDATKPVTRLANNRR